MDVGRALSISEDHEMFAEACRYQIRKATVLVLHSAQAAVVIREFTGHWSDWRKGILKDIDTV